MKLFPAIDLHDGKAVRLKQGRLEESTVFSLDPVETALFWQDQGAHILHVVDLDAAFKGSGGNAACVAMIAQALDIPLQLGGGLRDEKTVDFWVDAGVSRLVLGTMPVENPGLFAKLCKKYPGCIGASFDARDGILKTRGWVEDTGLSVFDALPRLEYAAFLVYTDIAKDGMQEGPNTQMLLRVAEASPVPVIASGGITTLDDLKALYPLSLLKAPGALEGVIIGRALYEKNIALPEALAWLEAQPSANA